MGSLEDLPPEAGAAAALARLLRDHPDPEVRAEAVDTYAEQTPALEAAEVLGRRAAEDPSERVREDALDALAEPGEPGFEALGDSEDPRAEAVLEDLLSRP